MAASASLSLPLVYPIPETFNGKITLTSPAESVYLLSFSSPPDNRLTPAFLTTFINALEFVEKNVPHSSVLITTSEIDKFYSNGFNLELAMSTPGFWRELWNKLQIKLLTFPMPLVSLMNGHSFAAGFMTAMTHDYRIMNPSRGWCCLNEIDFGGELSPSMTSIFREKLDARTYRDIVLEGKRFTGPMALESGIVDGLGGLPEALALIEKRKLVGKGGTGVYARLRDEMYRDTIRLLQRYGGAGFQREETEINGLPSWSKL